MRVYAPIAQQPANMQLRRVLLHMLYSLQEGRIVIERAIPDRLAHACIVLQDALARANILMPHFRIAHLPFWQANCLSRSLDGSMRPISCDLINVGGPRPSNSIALPPRINAPAIHNDRNKRPGSPV